MNKIFKLFDERFVRQLFQENILPLYPEALDIGQIKIKPYKKLVWDSTYHVVLDFLVEFKLSNGRSRKTHIICSAHSNEPREIAFKTLKYLWKRRLGKGVSIPRPLFYSDYFRGSFYRALDGKNLFYFISIRDSERVKDLAAKTGIMFARLHGVKLNGQLPDFSKSNYRIETVIPGIEFIEKEINCRYGGRFQEKIVRPYRDCADFENSWLDNNQELCLVHGDAHVENIIRVSRHRIGLIDFTDFSLSDYARDVGTFLQQLEYRLSDKFSNQEFPIAMKKLFLKNYLEESGKNLSSELQKRLNNYYNWAALRTASYWLLKDKSEPIRAEKIFKHLDKINERNLNAQD